MGIDRMSPCAVIHARHCGARGFEQVAEAITDRTQRAAGNITTLRRKIVRTFERGLALGRDQQLLQR